MKIAVMSEVSAADKNGDIVKALSGRGHEIINAGMKDSKGKPELQYIHTGLLAALVLNLQRADFVVGGCGTGQGFLNAAMQYPGVFCGHILTPLDAWLFMQINGGNCISLALNQGYGWAGDVNLTFIFDRLFSVERGCGYPPHRREPQAASRRMLEALSRLAHNSFAQIVSDLPEEVLRPVLGFPGVRQLLDLDSVKDAELRAALSKRL
jgi:ribose 5-phosphate isomerase RpiB